MRSTIKKSDQQIKIKISRSNFRPTDEKFNYNLTDQEFEQQIKSHIQSEINRSRVRSR